MPRLPLFNLGQRDTRHFLTASTAPLDKKLIFLSFFLLNFKRVPLQALARCCGPCCEPGCRPCCAVGCQGWHQRCPPGTAPAPRRQGRAGQGRERGLRAGSAHAGDHRPPVPHESGTSTAARGGCCRQQVGLSGSCLLRRALSWRQYVWFGDSHWGTAAWPGASAAPRQPRAQQRAERRRLQPRCPCSGGQRPRQRRGEETPRLLPTCRRAAQRRLSPPRL